MSEPVTKYPDEGKIVLSIPIGANEARILRAAAWDRGMSRAAFVREAVREAIKRYSKNAPEPEQ